MIAEEIENLDEMPKLEPEVDAVIVDEPKQTDDERVKSKESDVDGVKENGIIDSTFSY